MNERSALQFIILILLSISSVYSEFMVIEPEKLAKKFSFKDQKGKIINSIGNIEFSVSTFGEIPLDETTNIEVVSPSKKNIYGCNSFKKPTELKAQKFVWIVRRGKCTYIKKAKNAQFSGAYAVIVVHDDPSIEIDDIIPYADSHFKSVHTPIVLISNHDGNLLLANFKTRKTLIMSLKIELKGKQSKVDQAELWITPSSLESYDLLVQLESALKDFGNSVQFTPKYKFHNLRGKWYDKSFLKKHCFSQGKYCSTDGEELHPHSVIQEGLRQICLWRSKRGNSFFWKYINHYRLCLSKFKFQHIAKLNCYKESFENSQVPSKVRSEVEDCIYDSFDDPDNRTSSFNTILESQENQYVYSDIYLVPAFLINGELLKEELTPKTISMGLCDELISKPPVCGQYLYGSNQFTSSHSFSKSIFSMLFILLIGSILLIVLLMYLYRRSFNKRVDRELYIEINKHVTNYMKLSN